MDSTSLAQLSNQSIYVAMIVITGAMLAFAASWAGARARRVAAADRAAVLVGAGAADATEATAVPESAEMPRGRRAANIGMALTWLGFGFLVLGVVLRG